MDSSSHHNNLPSKEISVDPSSSQNIHASMDANSHQNNLRPSTEIPVEPSSSQNIHATTDQNSEGHCEDFSFFHCQYDEYFRDYLPCNNTGNHVGASADQPSLDSTAPSFQDNYIDILSAALTQSGSRYLQRFLSKDHNLTVEIVLESVIDSIYRLMANKHGRHVFRKLIESCNATQLRVIISEITSESPHSLPSMNKYLRNSIKKLVKVLEREPEPNLIVELAESLGGVSYNMMITTKGSTLMLIFLKVQNVQINTILYAAAVDNCINLATHERGYTSLIEFIHYDSVGKGRMELLSFIAAQSMCLAQDPVGNFVLQRALKLNIRGINTDIITALRGHYVRLSMEKVGSFMVSACLESCEAGLEYVVIELLERDQLVRVANDRYGNYVIQAALHELKRAESPFNEPFKSRILANLSSLQTDYGRIVLNLITSGLLLN